MISNYMMASFLIRYSRNHSIQVKKQDLWYVLKCLKLCNRLKSRHACRCLKTTEVFPVIQIELMRKNYRILLWIVHVPIIEKPFSNRWSKCGQGEYMLVSKPWGRSPAWAVNQIFLLTMNIYRYYLRKWSSVIYYVIDYQLRDRIS